MIIHLTELILTNQISVFKSENKICIISPKKFLKANDVIELFEDIFKLTSSENISFDTDFVFNNDDFVVEKYILNKVDSEEG